MESSYFPHLCGSSSTEDSCPYKKELQSTLPWTRSNNCMVLVAMMFCVCRAIIKNQMKSRPIWKKAILSIQFCISFRQFLKIFWFSNVCKLKTKWILEWKKNILLVPLAFSSFFDNSSRFLFRLSTKYFQPHECKFWVRLGRDKFEYI